MKERVGTKVGMKEKEAVGWWAVVGYGKAGVVRGSEKVSVGKGWRWFPRFVSTQT